ncbi:MAG: HIT domain-containing protein [Oscillospiraceae bacterium]|jgi:histidine triad (HIT) family protein|nr:HIT domain-containing protein [Oscillospiraceae bacterium]
MDECLFCRIQKEDSPKVYEDELIVAFNDIAPKAPVHILIIPREHIVSAARITPEHGALLAHLWTKIPVIAKDAGLTDFRVVTNAGSGAGQSVDHLHFHLIGGGPLNIVL